LLGLPRACFNVQGTAMQGVAMSDNPPVDSPPDGVPVGDLSVPAADGPKPVANKSSPDSASREIKGALRAVMEFLHHEDSLKICGLPRDDRGDELAVAFVDRWRVALRAYNATCDELHAVSSSTNGSAHREAMDFCQAVLKALDLITYNALHEPLKTTIVRRALESIRRPDVTMLRNRMNVEAAKATRLLQTNLRQNLTSTNMFVNLDPRQMTDTEEASAEAAHRPPPDTEKKSEKKRRIMHKSHHKCVAAFMRERKKNPAERLKPFVMSWVTDKDVIEEFGELSLESFHRTIRENREFWDTERTRMGQ
jgi:hypothetical protein